MIFFKPQVTLTKIINIGAPDEYQFTAETLCDKSNFCATGFDVANQLNSEGNLEVLLFLGQDSTVTETNASSTVEHSVSIGQLPNAAQDIDIEVITATSAQESGRVGQTKVKSASAGEHGRSVIG